MIHSTFDGNIFPMDLFQFIGFSLTQSVVNEGTIGLIEASK